MYKNNRGITLIALVITIIVLIILAGVSIAILTGDNGILTKASNASEETKKQGALEKVKIAIGSSYNIDGLSESEIISNLNKVEGIDKSTIKDSLPMTVKVDGVEIEIDVDGKTTIITPGSEGGLPTTDDTKPYLPEGSTVVEKDLSRGIVIKDSNMNEWVWVEVPKSIFITAKNTTDYINIEKDMQNYVAEYGLRTDVWYNGCGIETEEEYNELKNKMLESVYTNGGFYIGRYETGTDTLKPSVENELTTPLIQADKYPYQLVRFELMQQSTKSLSTGGRTASLLFGIQWDLVCKFMEEKGVLQDGTKVTFDMVAKDSSSWANYCISTFTVNKGKYSTDNGKTYLPVPEGYTKPKDEKVIFTTGATDRNKVLNIYDFSGNDWEFTLEKGSYRLNVFRGGGWGYSESATRYCNANAWCDYFVYSDAYYSICSRASLY